MTAGVFPGRRGWSLLTMDDDDAKLHFAGGE
jgi:hypothetical protein